MLVKLNFMHIICRYIRTVLEMVSFERQYDCVYAIVLYGFFANNWLAFHIPIAHAVQVFILIYFNLLDKICKSVPVDWT